MTDATKAQLGERGVRVFRVALVGVLALLIGSGFTLEYTNVALAKQLEQITPIQTPSKAETQSAPASQTASQSPSETVTETPAPVDPVLEKIRAHQAATGCRMHLDTAVPVQTLGTCKLLLVGDSIGNNLGYGMIGQLGKYKNLKFVLKAKSSTGLSNSWFYNWETNLKNYLKVEKPNIVVVMLGANDRQNMKVNGEILTYGTSKWRAAYSASVARMTKLATDAGAYVLWVGMPKCKPYNYNKGMELISTLFSATVRQNSGARFIALRPLTSDANGNYTQYQTVNGSRLKTRGDDGIHFTANGQNVIGTYAISKIAGLFRVALKSSVPRIVTK